MTKVIQLIRSPLDDWYKVEQLEDLLSAPIGLCMLANFLRKNSHEAVFIHDSIRHPFKFFGPDTTGDIVGVTDIYSSHLNSLAILKAAKKNGAITVIGGPNVNNLAERILANHLEIDFAVVGDGRMALEGLVLGRKLEKIPNLVYRKDDKIQRNPRGNYYVEDDLFDLENLRSDYSLNIENAFPVAAVKGCIKREETGPCSFCSINTELQTMPPELAWKQIGLIHGMYGPDYFWEVGDDFIVDDYPERFLAARPEHLNHIALKVYTSPDRINPSVVRTLNNLNARAIFLGIETTSDLVLKKANKSYRQEDITNALRILEDECYLPEGELHIPFIYGLPGETLESAEKTLSFAANFVEKYPINKIVVSLPIPFPGTKLFRDLRRDMRVRKEYTKNYDSQLADGPGYSGDLDKDDFFDYQTLIRLQCKYFTDVTYDAMVEKIEQTKALFPSRGNVTSFDINR